MEHKMLYIIFSVIVIYYSSYGFDYDPGITTNVNNTSHSVYEYKNGAYVEYIGGDGHTIYLENNPDAVDPTYAELISFVKSDDTDKLTYSDTFVCADFAEMLHNNAESNGIKSAFVAIDFFNSKDGHALNAFYTIDKGIVYIDSTGVSNKITRSCGYDKKVELKINEFMRTYNLYKCGNSKWVTDKNEIAESIVVYEIVESIAVFW